MSTDVDFIKFLIRHFPTSYLLKEKEQANLIYKRITEFNKMILILQEVIKKKNYYLEDLNHLLELTRNDVNILFIQFSTNNEKTIDIYLRNIIEKVFKFYCLFFKHKSLDEIESIAFRDMKELLKNDLNTGDDYSLLCKYYSDLSENIHSRVVGPTTTYSYISQVIENKTYNISDKVQVLTNIINAFYKFAGDFLEMKETDLSSYNAHVIHYEIPHRRSKKVLQLMFKSTVNH